MRAKVVFGVVTPLALLIAIVWIAFSTGVTGQNFIPPSRTDGPDPLRGETTVHGGAQSLATEDRPPEALIPALGVPTQFDGQSEKKGSPISNSITVPYTTPPVLRKVAEPLVSVTLPDVTVSDGARPETISNLTVTINGFWPSNERALAQLKSKLPDLVKERLAAALRPSSLSSAEIVERLDRILNRLDDMDARLGRLEKTERQPPPSWNHGASKDKATSGFKK